MFRALFEEYKEKVVEIKSYESLKDLEIYKKIGLGFFLCSIILSSILFFLKFMIAGLISYCISIISLVITWLFMSRPKERKRILKEKIIPTSERKFLAMKLLLERFKINYKDKEVIELLIQYAEGERNRADITKGLMSCSKTLSTYVVIPMITYVLTKISENLSVGELVVGMVVTLIFVILLIIVLVSSYSIFNDIFNRDVQKYTYFIADLKQIILFNDYECENTNINNDEI